MKKVFLFATAAAMLAACSSNDSLDTGRTAAVTTPLEEGAVGFDAYTFRSVTRSGYAGQMGIDQLKANNFGVFGFYTDNNDYDPQSQPNFFYNQKVEYKNSQWSYDPVKYWPNEYGETAISDDADKVSFFAYAPYVNVTPATGKLVKDNDDDDKWGITGLTRNSATGDPMVKYIASFDAAKSVDLLWGVCDEPNDWTIVKTGSAKQLNGGVQGLPWLNVERPLLKKDNGEDQRLKFTFKHALAQLTVNVDAFVDGTDNAKGLDSKTRIYVRSVSFTGIATKGALNLNNTEKDKALWIDYGCTADLESGEVVTVFDGRKDGKEGASGSVASNEKILGLNDDIIQTDQSILNGAWAAASPGVNNVTRPLFKSSLPIYVIPTGEENIDVEIVYDVETIDGKLANYVSDAKTNGSTIENRIKKSVKFGDVTKYENGKHYTINLHLGMNSVKLDAEVTDWVEAESEAHVDLPSNLTEFEAGATKDITLPYNLTSYQFSVTGLNGGSTFTGAGDNTIVTAVTSGNANSSGVADITATIAENKTVKKVTGGSITITGSSTTTLNITQLAHPLGLSVGTVDADGKGISLASTATIGSDWFAEDSEGNEAEIKVYKNGTLLTKVDTPDADGEYKFDGNTGKITLFTEAQLGDTYTITLKTGDADEETTTAKIGGIAFVPATRSLVYKTSAYAEVPSPRYYGVEPTAYTWTSGTEATATIAADGKVTTVTPGTSEIKAVATQEAANGWFFTTNSKTATYALTVTKQPATITLASQNDVPAQDVAANGNVGTANAATITPSIDGSLTPEYVVSATVDGSACAEGTFTIDGGQVKVGNSALQNSKTYVVTVTAKLADADAEKYQAESKSYTFNVTTAE